MRHSEDDFLNTKGRRVLDDMVEERYQRFAAFEGEALLPEKLRMKEVFEQLCSGQLLEDAMSLAVIEVRMVLAFFHQLAQPSLTTRILHVRELDADRAAIGLAKPRQNLAQGLDRAAR